MSIQSFNEIIRRIADSQDCEKILSKLTDTEKTAINRVYQELW